MAFSLEAVFGVDASGARAELKSLRKDLGNFASDMAKLGAGVAIGAFVALSKSAIDLAGRLSDTSQNIGINVESLQALEAQHKRNGVSSEQLTKALEKVKSAVISSAEGDKTATAALEKLHLKSSALLRLPLAEQYAQIAKSLAKAQDKAEAYSAVTALLGEKVGPKLMTSLVELGEIGLPGVTKSAKEAGQVMSVETIAALDRAGDAIDDFKKKATVAVGDILVNFRTEEGVKLLWLQLSRVVLNFLAGIVDAIYEGGNLISAVWKGSLRGVLNFFQDGLVAVVEKIAGLLNKILPEKFEINVGNLEKFRSSGRDISDEIALAIGQTKPLGLRDTLNEATTQMVKEQTKVVDAVNKIDLKPEADKLKGAGTAIKTSLKEAAKPLVEDAPKAIIEAGSIAARALMDAASTLSRVGKSYIDQSDASLGGVLTNLKKQLSTAEIADRNRVVGVGGVDTSITTNMLRGELASIQQEINARAQVRSVVGSYGENAARAQFGDTLVDRALRDMQTDTTKTAIATQNLNANVAALAKKFGVTPIG